MSELPEGWASVMLGDVVEVLDSEREPINNTERQARIAGKATVELFRYFGATGQVGWIDSFRSDGQRVLLGEDGAPFLDPTRPKAYLVSGRFWVNNHAHVLRGIAGVLDNAFLCHQLNVADYHDAVTGSTRLKLTSAAMKRIPLVLPPLAEQRRIVEKFDELLPELESGAAELKVAQAKLQRYRQSLLKAAVQGELTADWRAANPPAETGAAQLQRILAERRARWEGAQRDKAAASGKALAKGWQAKYPEPTVLDEAGLPTLPDGWIWSTLDMLGEIASGVAKGGKAGPGTPLREVPYLRVANVQRGRLDLQEVKTILASEADIRQLALRDGDVLFNEGGDRDKLGRGWVWREQVPECIHQNHVFRMRPFLPAMHPEFISHHGNGFGQQWFQSVGKQTTNLASINLGMLRAFPVPVPPAAEQARIAELVAEALAAADAMQAAIARSLAQSAAQRQNILRAAFAGQLVPQDPADEPADVLLARMRGRREGTKAPARKRAARTAC